MESEATGNGDLIDKKTQEAISDVYYGTLSRRITKNMKHAATGVMIGAFAGVVFGTLTGKCKLCMGVWGALGGGGIGYLTAK